jgi:hypothetical protein
MSSEPRVAAVRNATGVVTRLWLPRGEHSQSGFFFDGETWRSIDGDALASACKDASLPLLSNETINRHLLWVESLLPSPMALPAIAMDAKRRRCWISCNESLWMFDHESAGRCIAQLHATHILPSPDGQSVLVASGRMLFEQRLSDENLHEVELVQTFADSIAALCRTPAGIAVIVERTLIGLNLRTRRHAVIVGLPHQLEQAAIAADHRGNFTFATATDIWTCRSDASGMQLEFGV